MHKKSKIELFPVFTEELPGDPLESNIPRQVTRACYSMVLPKGMSSPKLIALSEVLADELGLDPDYCVSPQFADIMTGKFGPKDPFR